MGLSIDRGGMNEVDRMKLMRLMERESFELAIQRYEVEKEETPSSGQEREEMWYAYLLSPVDFYYLLEY